MENVICVVSEAQTFKTWVPMIYKSEFLHKVTDVQNFGEIAIKMPWPIEDRVCYCCTNAEVRLDSDSVIISLRSIDSDIYHADKKIIKDSKCKECDVKYSAM